MPDQHHEDALEHIEALLRMIEGLDSSNLPNDLADYLGSIAEKAVTLRDRMNNEEGHYEVGGS